MTDVFALGIAQAKEDLDKAWHYTYGDGADPVTGQAFATMAVAEALVAIAPLIREIGDQLDTFPRSPRRCDEIDSMGQQCNLRFGHVGGHRVGLGPHRLDPTEGPGR
jgi:hypothetical protein